MTDDERKVVEEGWAFGWPHVGNVYASSWALTRDDGFTQVAIVPREVYESLLADQARFAICMSHGFPVRNQTAQTLDRMWTISGRYWGATTLECIDNALAPELPPAPGVER